MDASNRVDGRLMRGSVIVLDADADEQISFREFLVTSVHCVVIYSYNRPQFTPVIDLAAILFI